MYINFTSNLGLEMLSAHHYGFHDNYDGDDNDNDYDGDNDDFDGNNDDFDGDNDDGDWRKLR